MRLTVRSARVASVYFDSGNVHIYSEKMFIVLLIFGGHLCFCLGNIWCLSRPTPNRTTMEHVTGDGKHGGARDRGWQTWGSTWR